MSSARPAPLRLPWSQWLAWVTALACLVVPAFVVLAPWLRDTTTYGFHDWDVVTSHRYLAVLSLSRYHELPGWNPYACGGFPGWAYIESGTIVVSPFLPAYLLLPMPLAIRVEVLGMGLLGAVGAYLLASRFVRGLAPRALVAVLWAVNGRFALQAAAGHTWHLAYALLPLALALFEDARQPDARPRSTILAALVFAWLVYAGGIYPLPHTVLTVGLYAAAMAWTTRSLRPLTTLASVGGLSVLLSAPKLVPMLDTFLKYPRLIESKEVLELGTFVTLLTSREQAFGARPARIPAYGWHEWGMYIGWAGLLALVLGLGLSLADRRAKALAAIGALLTVLGFGAFHELAPWTLMHAYVPMFQSQHVPSRFLYPALLVLGLVAAMGWDRWQHRAGLGRPWLDVVLTLCVLGIGLDVASVAQKPMTQSMWMVAPKLDGERPFSHAKAPPFNYLRRDWAGPVYLAMRGNTGVLDCYGTPPFERRGALAKTDARYRGEVEVVGQGSTRLDRWSPNEATIALENTAFGDVLVYNMNFDEGWSVELTGASGTARLPAENRENRLAVTLPADVREARFVYTPPNLGWGLALGALGLGLVGALVVRDRKERS